MKVPELVGEQRKVETPALTVPALGMAEGRRLAKPN
jgi:hypothetical protein